MAEPGQAADGEVTFIRGQDASRVPDQVQPGGYFAGINISTDDASLKPRWGLDKKGLDYTDNATFAARSPQTVFESGRFQAYIPYSVGDVFYQIVVIAGVIYIINQDTFEIKIMPITDGSRLNENSPRLNWEPAGRFLVIHDYPAFPVLIEGFTARRADPAKFEVPVSVIGAYNSNRLFIGNIGNEFTGGDPIGNPLTPDAPITFEEVLIPGAPYFGQVFQLTTNYNNDPITAMAFLQVTDTSTGIGPFLVSTRSAVYAYQVQNPRAIWDQGQFGTNYLYSVGIAGPRAFTNTNSDIFMESSDGQIRSLSMARNAQNKWANTAISREVQNWLKFYDIDLAKYASLCYFKNKVFITCNPFRVESLSFEGVPVTDYAHAGMVVLNLSNISGLQAQDTPPVWDGLWTGTRPMDMIVNNERMFIISKDPSFKNTIYEVMPQQSYDTDGSHRRFIRSRLYTREYLFESAFNNKELQSIDLALTNVKGKLNLDLHYKPSHAADFKLWRNLKYDAPWEACSAGDLNCIVNGFAGQSFRQLNLGYPLEGNLTCEPVSQDLYTTFRRVQLRFTIEAAYWELRGFLIHALMKPQDELTPFACEEIPPVCVTQQCNDDWAVEPFQKCQS